MWNLLRCESLLLGEFRKGILTVAKGQRQLEYSNWRKTRTQQKLHETPRFMLKLLAVVINVQKKFATWHSCQIMNSVNNLLIASLLKLSAVETRQHCLVHKCQNKKKAPFTEWISAITQNENTPPPFPINVIFSCKWIAVIQSTWIWNKLFYLCSWQIALHYSLYLPKHQ